MASVWSIPSGHEGSGRDGRTGDREQRRRHVEGRTGTIGQFNLCPHWFAIYNRDPEHVCWEYENELRKARGCPPMERT